MTVEAFIANGLPATNVKGAGLVIPTTITKRDGRVVSFDVSRIENAIARCFASVDRTPQTPVADLAQRAVNIMAAKASGATPTVEGVQDIVEMVLQGAGEFAAAKSYILYRAEHAKQRMERPVPAKVREAFDQSRVYFPTAIQQFQYFDKYARFNYELGRRETWIETVDRAMDYMYELAGDRLPRETYERVRRGILEMRAMPSMRLLAMAGPAARRNSIAIYNCSYQPVESIDSFVEALIISMAGCGVGFSVESQYVENFPRVKRQTNAAPLHYTVEDSAEGWADGLRFGLQTWFEGGDVRFDLTQLRSAGAALKTKGGRASGPEPLRTMFDFTRARILARQGSFLRSLDAHDIMCAVGNAAVSGGVRRTAMISLFDYDDEEMRLAKSGDFERENSQRWNANNSTVWPQGGLTQGDFISQFMEMVNSGRGEPGIFNRVAANSMKPARRAEAEFGTNPCVTGDTWIAVADGRGRIQMKDLVIEGKDVDVYTVKDGKLAVRTMRNPRLTGTNVPIYRVRFADGSDIRVTANHKFQLTNGNFVEAVNLKSNDALVSMTVVCQGYDKDNKKTTANYDAPKAYRMLTFRGIQRSEHRFLYEHHTGIQLSNENVLHHKDFNSLNNHVDNLIPMTVAEHNALHDVRGGANPNALQISNEELEERLLAYIRHLGHRPSVVEYTHYAKQNKLPQSFQQYRQEYFGGNVQETLTKIAEQVGVNQPKFARPLAVEKTDLPVHYHGSIAYVTKRCEYCDKSFEVQFRRREIATCSLSCGNKLYYQLHGSEPRKQAIRIGHSRRKDARRQQQITAYNDLTVALGRHPMKDEWMTECQRKGISPEISRVSSPFRYWKDLQNAASTANHRVLAVEIDGYEDVYNGTVDDTHTYFTIGSERTRYERTEMSYVLSRNCGEIVLREYGFCNLSAAVARADDTAETLRDKVEIATIIGSIQSMATHFPGLRPMWQQNCEEERLLGVDITGQMDSPAAQDGALKAQLRDVAIEVNRQMAAQLGIKQSASITCVKPSGNSSQLLNCSSGLHTRWAPYYVRNIRVAVHSPLFKVLRDAGTPMDPENGQTPENATTWVIHFPVKAPEGSVTRRDRTAVQQCEFWLQNKLQWTEHNPSCTITYQPDEVIDVMKWVWEHREQIGGLSFLPSFDANYAQMPYVEIGREEYEKLVADFPEIDFSKVWRYEEEDLTTAAMELACMSGSCEVDLI